MPAHRAQSTPPPPTPASGRWAKPLPACTTTSHCPTPFLASVTLSVGEGAREEEYGVSRRQLNKRHVLKLPKEGAGVELELSEEEARWAHRLPRLPARWHCGRPGRRGPVGPDGRYGHGRALYVDTCLGCWLCICCAVQCNGTAQWNCSYFTKIAASCPTGRSRAWFTPNKSERTAAGGGWCGKKPPT